MKNGNNVLLTDLLFLWSLLRRMIGLGTLVSGFAIIESELLLSHKNHTVTLFRIGDTSLVG